MNKRDFIVCTPLHLVFHSNGVLTLIKLAQAIEKTGRKAYICAYHHVNGQEAVLNVDFERYVPANEAEVQFVGAVKRAIATYGLRMLDDFSASRIDQCYVVYPEVMLGNALNARNVIRYFLNKDGTAPGTQVRVGPNDFLLAHSRTMHPNPHHVCYYAEINPIFHSEGTYPAEHRQLDLMYLGKGAAYGYHHIVPETVVITRTWPQTKEQLAILLRNCRFFYTADACSSLNVEALACGAIPAFLDYGPWTPEEIDSFEPGVFPRLYDGIQTGDNFFAEFEVERATYFGKVRSFIEGWDASVAAMIDKADAHFTVRPASSARLSGRGPLRTLDGRERASTMFGEKIGEAAFYPYRTSTLALNGVKRWFPAPLAHPPVHGGRGFALINHGDRSAWSDGFELAPGQLALVTHAAEAMSSRSRILDEGVYAIAARFSQLVSSAAPRHELSASVCVNGKTLWRHTLAGAGDAVYTGFLDLPSGSFIDLSAQAPAAPTASAANGGQSGVALQFAIFRCDQQTGALIERCDDECSGLTTQAASAWLAGAAFPPSRVEAASIALHERARIFREQWTLDERYLKSQFGADVDALFATVAQRRKKPDLRYAFCFTPRSGSTLIAEILTATGKLGYPIEYFVPEAVRCISLAFADTFTAYEEVVAEGFQTSNNVFGIQIEAERFIEERGFFSSLADWRVVYLTRKDILAQAISFIRASTSNVWHRFGASAADAPVAEAALDRATVIAMVNRLLRQEQTFERVFREDGVEPLRLTYEEFITNPAFHTRAIADHVGVAGLDFSSVDIGRTMLQPTRNEINRKCELAAVMQGGEYSGYDIVQVSDQQYAAVLAGVDRTLLSFESERPPILFLAKDLERLRARLATFIALQLSLDSAASAGPARPTQLARPAETA